MEPGWREGRQPLIVDRIQLCLVLALAQGLAHIGLVKCLLYD